MKVKLPELPTGYTPPHEGGVQYFADDMQAYARQAIRDALEGAAAEITELADSHARQAGEERGDPECDFQTAWDQAAAMIRGRKPELDDADR